MSAATDPLAIALRRRVRPDRATDHEAPLLRLARGKARTCPGRMGAEFHRPGTGAVHRGLSHFDSPHGADTFFALWVPRVLMVDRRRISTTVGVRS